MRKPLSTIERLGKHHFAHLKAVAMGVPFQAAALRYLGIHHGHQAAGVHRLTVESVRALARRQHEPAWRLIGLVIRVDAEMPQGPSLAEFIATRGLEDWSEEDVGRFYLEAYPEQADAAGSARAKRRERLRSAQLGLLEKLEKRSVVPPSPVDPVATWFDPVTAQRLVDAGMVSLLDLADRIALGGRWFGAMPGVGVNKAERIAAFLRDLLGDTYLLQRHFVVPLHSDAAALRKTGLPDVVETAQRLPSQLTYEPAYSLLAARSDADAIEEWIAAKAGSKQTALGYRREARRLLLWLLEECGGKGFGEMTAGDCAQYAAFLADIPLRWRSKARAKPGAEGWAPFRGPLSHQSRQYALNVLGTLFTWLQAAQYIPSNPWVLVNTKLGDDPAARKLDTKAIGEGAMAEILRVIHAQPDSPSRTRILFILGFVEAVGLRSQELISARLKDFSLEPEGWVLHVHGKGAKNRVAAVPGQALDALQAYLRERGLGGIETASGDYPLLASLGDSSQPVGYQALHEHVKGWLKKAVAESALPEHERRKLAGASTHWLRHTFGTRAVARNVPLDVIQEQLGHASIQTTMNIYGRAPIQRRTAELGKAFDTPSTADT
ncbi:MULTISPECIES: tyrosine-type recombinase/integrase [Cupriavidus]|jgi:integrase|uniref:tyrosine-type recombinase/integrase n=1 Tax=Cupriavidus TaxID=106589 RepID=UPI000464F49E|nr:tyrosine-type recombinase/integrase [Cupriavidus metallidurans]KWW32328.1 Tyrosine recombinase XerC [Cupriavidus metallidurans]